MTSIIKVGVNGYGTIGRRVADAVSKQDDMKLVGVTKTKPSWEAESALKKGIDLYCANTGNIKNFEHAKIKLSGTLDDLAEKVDVMVDCSPGKIGADYKEKVYVPNELNAIFQGGEKAEVADISFVAQCNYEKALGKKYIRCVSCNTTGIARVLGSLDDEIGVKNARVVLIRRSADPGDSKNGPVDAIIPDPIKTPSHHGSDVNTVLPDINIITSAVRVPTTLMHLHTFMVKLNKKSTEDQILDIFEKNPRIKLINYEEGLISTAEVMEYAKGLGRPRNDLYENIIWKDSIGINGTELYFFQAIHQEAIVIPENIDAIRAMFELEKNPIKSINKTNKCLGI